MKFNSDEIASVIQQEIEQFESQIDVRDVGRVLEVGDGIARVYGLSGVMAQEMVEFPNGVIGLAFNLEENSVGIIILGDYLQIAEGDEVRSTGRLLSVPVGDELLGRVVDPLGNPLDGKGPIVTKKRRPVEIIAPGVAERAPVSEPLQTGIKAIDAMTPDRPRSTRADHRRPQNRQNRCRHRCDHQSTRFRREVLLRRDRPEGLDGSRRDRKAHRNRRDGLTPPSSFPGQAPQLRCNMSPRIPEPRWPNITCSTAATR